MTQCIDVSRLGSVVCGIVSPGNVKRGDKRTTPLPPRVEPKRRRRGAEHGLGQAISACSMDLPPGHAADGHRRAGTGLDNAEGDWIKPWERRPDWEYLPHLDGRGGGATPAGTPVASGQQGNHPPLHVDGSFGDRHRCNVDTISADGAAHEIRGRVSPLGARVRDMLDGCAQTVDDAGIRGHSQVPGPTGNPRLSRAQERLNAKNTHLARSLADHAERVTRRNMAGDRPAGASAAARLEALRRRVTARFGTGVAMDAQVPVEDEYRGAAVVAGRGDGQLLGGDDGTRERGGDAMQASNCSLIEGTNGQGGEAHTESQVTLRMAAASSGARGDAQSVASDAGNRCLGDEQVHGAGGRDSIEEYKIHYGAEVEEEGCGGQPSPQSTRDAASAAAAAADAWHARGPPGAADGASRLSAR